MEVSELLEHDLGHGGLMTGHRATTGAAGDALPAERHRAGPAALHEFRRLGALATGQP